MILLMIDDEPTSFDIVKATLNWDAFGIQPEYADSAHKAMEIIKHDMPDIILTDIMMPDIDGFELIEWIKANSYNCEIIILTAYGTFEYAHKALDFGVTGYLLKPIKEKELEKLLQKAINNINSNAINYPDNINIKPEQIYSRAVKMACEYINIHSYENINLDRISSYVSLSKNYFCNIFKKEIGVTVWDYLIRIRMEKAKKMLLESSLKTYEISDKIGYDDSSYFSRLFKRYTGYTPTEFRENKKVSFPE